MGHLKKLVRTMLHSMALSYDGGSSMKRTTVRSLGCLLTFWALLFTGAAYGQGDRGTLAGTVTDASKGAIPGAAVTVANTSTGFTQSTETGTSGEFRFSSVPMGTYSVTVD